MNYLPIYLNITGKSILVIGGGKTALQKVKMLQQFTSDITVTAKEICGEITARGVQTNLSEFTSDILQGFALVYACTDNKELNRQIKNDAEKLGILVNVVDDPWLCDFITPAVYTDKNFSIAVSTSGVAPSGAAEIRDRIRNSLPAEELNEIVERKRNQRQHK
jgi:siroheme synthase-like protein